MEEEFNTMSEFSYGESTDLGRGRHHQVIYLGGKAVGYLITKETNWLAPLVESYVIPDVEKGLSEPTSGLLDGKLGWIDYKVFVDDYDAAFKYATENYEQILYLLEVGDYD